MRTQIHSRLLGLSLMLLTLPCSTALCQVPAKAAEVPKPVSAAAQIGDVQDHERYPRYQLQKSDVIELGFTFSPEFNQTVTVQPDGFITLKDIGDLQVEGLTVPQLIQKLRTAYSGILADPVITITLKDFERPYFIAGGQVTKPGKYDLRGDTTLTQAIEMAGGFNNSAKHSQVVLYRKASAGWLEARLIDVKKMMKSRDLREDVHLKPGDMIFVPQNTLSKISRYIPTSGISIPIY